MDLKNTIKFIAKIIALFVDPLESTGGQVKHPGFVHLLLGRITLT